MNHKKVLSGFIALSMAISVAAPAELISLSDVLTVKAADQAGQKFTVGNGQNQHKADNVDGYSYEIWLDNTGGSGSMTLGSGGTFSTEWSAQVSSGNFLARRGRNYDASKKATEYGPIVMDYAADYSASSQGNSRLCVYGWMKNPLVEYYIIEDWVNWCPKPNGASKTVTIDGAEYEIFQLDHTGPTILGTTETFKQYFSVRKSKRTSGTITVSDHFKAWADAGWNIGNLTEVALNVEGWESSGKANVTKLSIGTGSGGSSNTQQAPQQNPGQNPQQDPWGGGDPNQQNPWGGQMPWGDQNPNGGGDPNQQNPWGGQMPWGDQNPNGGGDPNQQNPWGGQMPWGDQNPVAAQDPNQQNPWGGQMPWGDQNPNGGQAPQGQQVPQQTAAADFTFGDINDDTKIDITDLSLLAVHLIDKTNFTEKQKLSADVAYNGNIELADLATLRQFISKVITKLGEGYTAPANQPSSQQQPQQNPEQQNPWGGQMPWGDQNPNGGGDPNQQNPWGGQIPWAGDQNPNGGQNPGEQQVPQQTAKSTGSKGKVQNGVWTSDADVSWIDASKPMVAIAFDDGPIANSQNPGRIHKALTQNGFHATFFYWGERIAGNEQEIKNAFNAGFEVANHSWTHPNLTGQGDKGKSEYQRCKQALDAIIGGDNDYLLRPPYLNFDSGVGQAVGVPCPNCGLDTKDWDGASKDQILNTLKSALSNGSLRNKVVLCHENYDTTAGAMEEFLPYLKSQGWQCVTVSEMFKAQGKTMQAGQLYNECK